MRARERDTGTKEHDMGDTKDQMPNLPGMDVLTWQVRYSVVLPARGVEFRSGTACFRRSARNALFFSIETWWDGDSKDLRRTSATVGSVGFVTVFGLLLDAVTLGTCTRGWMTLIACSLLALLCRFSNGHVPRIFATPLDLAADHSPFHLLG